MTERHLKLALDVVAVAACVALLFATSPGLMHKLRADLRWLMYYAALMQYHTTRATAPAWLREAWLVRGQF